MLALAEAPFSSMCFHTEWSQGLLLRRFQLGFNSRKHRHRFGNEFCTAEQSLGYSRAVLLFLA